MNENADGALHEHSRGERYVVTDNLLSPTLFELAREEFESVRLKPGLSDIDPVYDGFSYRGGTTKIPLFSGDVSVSSMKRTVMHQIETSFRLFADEPLTNHQVTFTAWGYPYGSRLSWHNDGGDGRMGAFVYFVHSEWNARWGGELAIVDTATNVPVEADPYVLLDTGPSAILIRPVPNRLVLIKTQTFHAISRVDPTAGDRLRKSYSGFITPLDQ